MRRAQSKLVFDRRTAILSWFDPPEELLGVTMSGAPRKAQRVDVPRQPTWSEAYHRRHIENIDACNGLLTHISSLMNGSAEFNRGWIETLFKFAEHRHILVWSGAFEAAIWLLESQEIKTAWLNFSRSKTVEFRKRSILVLRALPNFVNGFVDQLVDQGIADRSWLVREWALEAAYCWNMKSRALALEAMAKEHPDQERSTDYLRMVEQLKNGYAGSMHLT